MPAGEVQITSSRVNSKGTRISNSNPESFAMCAIKLSDIKLFTVSVEPVQLTTDPIYSNPLQPMAVMANNWFLWFRQSHS
jgi:hypothetical protein